MMLAGCPGEHRTELEHVQASRICVIIGMRHYLCRQHETHIGIRQQPPQHNGHTARKKIPAARQPCQTCKVATAPTSHAQHNGHAARKKILATHQPCYTGRVGRETLLAFRATHAARMQMHNSSCCIHGHRPASAEGSLTSHGCQYAHCPQKWSKNVFGKWLEMPATNSKPEHESTINKLTVCFMQRFRTQKLKTPPQKNSKR